MELGFLGLGRHTKSPVKRFDSFPGFNDFYQNITSLIYMKDMRERFWSNFSQKNFALLLGNIYFNPESSPGIQIPVFSF